MNEVNEVNWGKIVNPYSVRVLMDSYLLFKLRKLNQWFTYCILCIFICTMYIIFHTILNNIVELIFQQKSIFSTLVVVEFIFQKNSIFSAVVVVEFIFQQK